MNSKKIDISGQKFNGVVYHFKDKSRADSTKFDTNYGFILRKINQN